MSEEEAYLFSNDDNFFDGLPRLSSQYQRKTRQLSLPKHVHLQAKMKRLEKKSIALNSALAATKMQLYSLDE